MYIAGRKKGVASASEVARNTGIPKENECLSQSALVKTAAAFTAVGAAVAFAIRRICTFIHNALGTTAVIVAITFAASRIGADIIDTRYTFVAVAAAAAVAIGISIQRDTRNTKDQCN